MKVSSSSFPQQPHCVNTKPYRKHSNPSFQPTVLLYFSGELHHFLTLLCSAISSSFSCLPPVWKCHHHLPPSQLPVTPNLFMSSTTSLFILRFPLRMSKQSAPLSSSAHCVWMAEPRFFVSFTFYTSYCPSPRLHTATLTQCFPITAPKTHCLTYFSFLFQYT